MANKFEIDGFDVLYKELEKLGAKLGTKTMRSALVAATKPLKAKYKMIAPVGSEPHRTYKGRLVAPGFLSRSIVSAASTKHGKISIRLGVKREAFYGVTFLDEKGARNITPFHWFKREFVNSENDLVENFRKELRKKLGKFK